MKNIFKVLALSFVLIANISAQENSEIQTQEVSLEAAQSAVIKSEKSALKAKFEQIKKWMKNNPKKFAAMSIPVAWWTASILVFVYHVILNKKFTNSKYGMRDVLWDNLKQNSLVANFFIYFICMPNLIMFDLLIQKFQQVKNCELLRLIGKTKEMILLF